jgi:RND family efflux transporter MFP subunit
MEGRHVMASLDADRRGAETPGSRRALGKAAFSLGGVAILVILFLDLRGNFGGEKVPPGTLPLTGERAPEGHPVPVVKEEVDELLEWPGTVRSHSTAQPAPKLLGRILKVPVDVGSVVREGDVLAVLDDRDVKARLDQAGAERIAAEAEAVQGEAEFARIQGLFDRDAATRRDLEAAQARATSARARAELAHHAAREADVRLSDCILRAPFDGVVTEKWAEAGDLAVPGKPIVAVQDPRRLRLEALVPETFARNASLGMEVRVRIDALGREITARIDEIAPAHDPESRSVLLKAVLPLEEDLRPGMFGRLVQPGGKKTALLVPASAVRRVGQLELVRMWEEGEARIRHVRTGKTIGERVEVISGVREGEQVLPQEN